MSDQNLGKKMVEESKLEHFIDAYKFVTGEGLVVVRRNERPDFVCERNNGSIVGVELTKVMRDPETAQADRILNYQEYMTITDALDSIYEAVARKAEKLKENTRLNMDKMILVLQLVDCQLSDMKNMLDDSLQKDFASYGLAEIWIADYTGLDAYGDIELFGLHPSKWWGYHQRLQHKPYG